MVNLCSLAIIACSYIIICFSSAGREKVLFLSASFPPFLMVHLPSLIHCFLIALIFLLLFFYHLFFVLFTVPFYCSSFYFFIISYSVCCFTFHSVFFIAYPIFFLLLILLHFIHISFIIRDSIYFHS